MNVYLNKRSQKLLKTLLPLFILFFFQNCSAPMESIQHSSTDSLGATNNLPTVTSFQYNLLMNTPLSQLLLGSDPDGDNLSYSIVTEPSHGSVTLSGNQFTYTPNTDFTGTDTFTFRAHDGNGYSVTNATITLNISDTPQANEAPVALNAEFNIKMNNSFDQSLQATDSDGDSLSYSIVSGPSHGNITLSGNQFTYTPNNDYTGMDSFTFRVFDGTAFSNTATISLTVYEATPGGGGIQFTDYTVQSGLLAATAGLDSRTWDVALADINNDGINDLYAMGHSQGPNQANLSLLFLSSTNLILNNITSSMVRRGGGQAALFTDLDADGNLDLITSSNDGVGAVFRNTGNGAYEWYGSDFPNSNYNFHAREMTRGDIDGDGDLDLFSGAERDEAYVHYNNGANVYSRVAFQTISQGQDDRSLTMNMFADFDKDGDLDAITQRMCPGWKAGECEPGNPITLDLWLNDGTGHFTWASDTHGLMSGTQYATTLVADFDNDADLDIVQLSPASRGGIRFFENNGSAYFTENANSRGFAGQSASFDWWTKSTAGDLDNDGDIDIVHLGKEIYINDGNGNFTKEDISMSYSGKITRLADLDGDGDLDMAGIWVAYPSGNELRGYYIHRNDTNDNNWLIVKVNAGANNPFGVGAKVKISNGSRLLGYREILNNSSMHQPLEAHFGLGHCTGACQNVSVEVTFPDGTVQTQNNITRGQKITISK